MKKIGIIGANGQVGLEVSLFLSLMGDVEVIPICRTEFSSVILRRLGFGCRHGSLHHPEEAKRLLADCDLVVDLTFPSGLLPQVRAATRAIVRNGIRFAPRNAAFVYGSTIMAFGMPQGMSRVRRCFWAHTPYGAVKRHGERRALLWGRLRRKKVYVLRLGQVHGELQSVSRGILRELDDEAICLPAGGDVPSPTVFCFSVAETLRAIAWEKESPGRYTLVSAPQWSWKEIYDHYAARKGVRVRLSAAPEGPPRDAKWWVACKAADFARRHREFIAAQVLPFWPGLELRVMGKFWCSSAAREIVEVRQSQGIYPRVLIGSVPGRRLRSLSDSRKTMEPLAREVREAFSSVFRIQHHSS